MGFKPNPRNLKLLTVVIVNWNGMCFLKGCLDSIFRSTYPNLEVILVDCASSDGSVQFVKENYNKINVIKLKKDPGFSAALNLGCKKAKGEYLLLLNNDVILPLYVIYCKLLRKSISEDEKGPFYVSLACTLLTKEMFIRNPVIEHFFLFEDIEWGWRLQLQGIKLKILKNVYIYHHGGLNGVCNIKVKNLKREKIIVGRGTYFAICSMNTSFVSKIVPAFYQMYMKYMGVDRFDDIWSGIFIKKLQII